jgi:hypothetical protein
MLVRGLLQNLDPSLFQNIILGVLALLIPIGVGILSFFFEERSRGNIYSNLELFVLVKTVLVADGIVIYSIVSLLLFALFSISLFIKIYAILFFIFYGVWLFSVPFKNIWKWFFESTKTFPINFLKSLDVKKDENIMLDSWRALWLGNDIKNNERDFTNIFVSHIADAVKFRKLDLAVQLAQIYVNNIEKRDRFSIGFEILPKVFKWNEALWNEQQLWLKSSDTEKRIQDFFPSKYFPKFFRDGAFNLYKKFYSKEEHFWNWDYFGDDFFQMIIKTLLKDTHGAYQLFASLKTHIDESEKKLDAIKDGEGKENYWRYIAGLLHSFCPTFFDEINKAPSNYDIWRHNFPQEWRITITNKDSRIARVVLQEFLQWAEGHIFKKGDGNNIDKDLTEVINGLFPNVHSSLFTAFLMLFSSGEVKYALEKEPNFYISGVSISWSGSVEESEEEQDRRIAEMMKVKETSQKEETIQIILKFFHFWETLTLYKDNLSEDESKKWESFAESERKSIVKRVRKEKLEKTREEIESAEVKEVCKDSEQKEFYRKNFLELIEILLTEIEK